MALVNLLIRYLIRNTVTNILTSILEIENVKSHSKKIRMGLFVTRNFSFNLLTQNCVTIIDLLIIHVEKYLYQIHDPQQQTYFAFYHIEE